MSVLPIVTVPNEILRCQAEDISDIDDAICKLAKDMIETMYKAPGIGLAANQVGKPLSLIVMDVEYAYAEPQHKKKVAIVVGTPIILMCWGEDKRKENCLRYLEY